MVQAKEVADAYLCSRWKRGKQGIQISMKRVRTTVRNFGLACVSVFAFAFTSAFGPVSDAWVSCCVVMHPDSKNARAMDAQTNPSAFIATFPGGELSMAILTNW
jgi:hypothetical protein